MKVCLIGFGKAGKALFSELINNCFVERTMVFDLDGSSFRSVPVETKNVSFSTDISDLEETFDLTVIASPDFEHFEQLRVAILNGTPTFVEKPYVNSRQQLDLVQELLSSSPNYKSTSNMILRTAPIFVEIRKLFLNGIFGSRVFIEGNYFYGRWEKIQNGWRGNKDYSVVLGGLIHLVDLVCYLTNNYQHKVALNYHRITDKKPSDVFDLGHLTLSSEKTGFASLTTNFSTSVEHRRDLSIYGDKENISIMGEEVWCNPKLFIEPGAISPAPPSKGALLKEFISYLQGETAEPIHFPALSEIFKVLELCLGNDTL